MNKAVQSDTIIGAVRVVDLNFCDKRQALYVTCKPLQSVDQLGVFIIIKNRHAF